MSAGAFECMNCRGTGSALVYRGCPDYYLRKSFVVDYYRCEECGLVQQSPIPDDVSPFYDSYPVHQRKSALHGALRRVAMSPAYFDASGYGEGSTILDYGCGDGWYLESIEATRASRIGFEPGAEHAATLSEFLGLPVYSDVGPLVAEYRGRVDAVTMHFVLEHVTDLHATLATVASLLKQGGRLHVVVPNASSWEARLFKRKWHGLDPPRHISFPDRAVMDSLAAAHGLSVVTQRPAAFSNGFAGSMPVVLVGRFVFPLFLFFLPAGIVLSRLAPSGATAFALVKD